MKLSISKPCNENWFRMTPQEKGKFCSVCHFTKATDLEIITTFNENENLCGRFNISQLNRNLSAQRQKPFWITAAATIITFLGLGNYTAKSQVMLGMPEGHSNGISLEDYWLCQKTINDSIKVSQDYSILIIDDNNQPRSEILIKIKGNDSKIYRAKNGKFIIKANENDTLIINDLDNEKITAYKLSEKTDITLVMPIKITKVEEPISFYQQK